MTKPTKEFLDHISYQIRRLSLQSTTQAGSGHPTSCLSSADILSALFFDVMHPQDYFILSKGHAAPALYSVYTLMGCISEKELFTLRQFNSPLEGHPTHRFEYIDVATGSLGQGLSLGLGKLLADTLRQAQGERTGRCFVLMGDSETTEGSVWEAAELASFYKLNNLVVIIDVNGLGQTTRTIDSLQTYQKKFEAFGWQTYITQGNNIPDLQKVLDGLTYQKPTCIIAHTLKGYGVRDVQDKEGFHGKVFTPQQLPHILEELKQAFPTAATYTGKKFPPTASTQKIKKQLSEKITFAEPTFKKGDLIATRKAFGKALEYAGSLNTTIISFDAEVNNSTYAEYFAQKYPQRFFQSFIAEQNMIGMAAGSTTRGVIPFASTFAAFLTRAYDQLRMTAIGKLPVRIVGSHCGVSVGQDGPSQMGLEDIALFRTLPESIILYPCDAVSTYRCVELMANHTTSISYLRTTRGDTPVIYDNNTRFEIGGCHIIKQTSTDTSTIIAAGVTVFEALKVAEKTPVTVIDCYSIKPLPIEKIVAAAQKTHHRIVIVEDHYAQGGLGEAVIAALANYPAEWQITHLAVTKLPMSGKPEELRAFESINADAIYKAVSENIN